MGPISPMLPDENSRAEIRWLDEFRPDRSPIHVRNELRMNVPAELAWAWLIRAARWPEWYQNSANVRFVNGPGPDLTPGAIFRWKTFGVGLVSEVIEFVPGERLAWNARGLGVWAYHAWLIRKIEGGCEVITEETQHGFACRLGKLFFPNRMFRWHQGWLEELQRRARTGGP